MNRRDMLKGSAGGAGAAGVGLLGQGCGHQLSDAAAFVGDPATPSIALPDQAVIDNVLRKMDSRLAWIDRQELPPELVPRRSTAPTPAAQASAEKHDLLFRQSVRTLYLTGRFMDLPDEIKTHPEVQARVMAAQPEMDDAVLGTTELLESLTPEDHRNIQATLRAHPHLGEQVAALLEIPAKEDGIPFKRRMGLRTATLQMTERMAAQSPAFTIDPQIQRVRRLNARPHREDGAARIMAARMGEEAFWQHQQRLADLSSAWARRLAQSSPAGTGARNPVGSTVPPYPVPSGARPQGAAAPAGPSRPASPTTAPPGLSPPPPNTTGNQVLSRGGAIMGFGLASVGVGLLFAGLNAAFSTEAFLWPALIFGITVGPILLIVGFVVVIVGAIMSAVK